MEDAERPATLGGSGRSDDTLRLFLALLVPDDVAAALARWRDSELMGAASERPVRAVPDFHLTLAFLGSRPRGDLAGVTGALRASAAETAPFELVPSRYRETRSVGMVVFDDSSGEAARLAERLHGRLEELGVYQREARPWLPHATVVRFSDRRRERPRLLPRAVEIAPFAPSEAAAFLSRLHPSGARYEILERCVLGTQEKTQEEDPGG